MLRKFWPLGLLLLHTKIFALSEPAPAIPSSLRSMIEAPLWPKVTPDPTRQKVLLLERAALLPIKLLAAPVAELGGEQIDLQLWAAKRTAINTNPSLMSLETRQTIPISVPRDRHIENLRFSPDGRLLALSIDADQGVEIWLTDTSTGAARRIEKVFLNDSFVASTFHWSADSKTLYVVSRENYQDALKAIEFDGPTVEEAAGVKMQVRTYSSLLRTADDQKLFQKAAQAQILAIDAHTLKSTKVGPAQPLVGFALSPNGEHLLLQTYAAPYSTVVPASLFAREVQILTLKNGSLNKIMHLAAAETVPPEGTRTGPRSVVWHLDHPARLLWWEALDEGDPKKKVPHRDRLMSWEFPFTGSAKEIFKTEERAVDLGYLPRADQIVVFDVNQDTNRVHVTWLDLKINSSRRLLDYDASDSYRHPGSFVEAPDATGRSRLVMDADRLFLAGQGHSEKGQQPFLDAFDINTGKTTRLFQSEASQPFIETPTFMFAGKLDRLVVTRQSVNTPPNLWFYDLKSKQSEPITNFVDNVPALTQAKKQVLVYKRKDGITLSGVLYLPQNYAAGTKLPAVIWAYPEEYRTTSAAGQVRSSDKVYSRPSPFAIKWLVTQGYAVLDDAAMPVVGDKETVNNTFVQQITSNAEAAINALDKLGVVDRKRVAIGGHSYGAFMTANLLAHSQLFCAGIARSGAYNRSLTPFGFQSERRTFWEAKDFYMLVSPFYVADKIKTPLLLIHGKKDTNPGTQTLQSERMFQALRGVGGTARLVLLPYESHGYQAKENVGLVQAESLAWLNRHCGGAKAGH